MLLVSLSEVARESVPTRSWVLLRGLCSGRRYRTSAHRPVLALGMAVLFAFVAGRLGPSAALPAFLCLTAVGVALAVIDLETRRLPDALTRPSYAVGGRAARGGGRPWTQTRAGCCARGRAWPRCTPSTSRSAG